MKNILICIIVFFFIQTGYSQKLFIYGEKGEKIYLQGIDSLMQIKFRKDASLNEQLKIVKSVDPETKFSESKSNHLIIPLKKGILPNLVNLNKESSVIYANKSLISADGIVQFPTEKVLVKVKASIQVKEILHSLDIDYESIRRLGSDKSSFLIKLKNGESIRIANLLYESGNFEYAQPSFTRLIKMQNEFYPNQWGLNNTGQNGGTVGIDINAPEAWTMTRGCNNMRVVVIDQGVDLDHPDLAGNLLPGFDATDGGDGGINGDCWGNDAHGTCCAGIIGAVNNTIGTIGVAHNCRIIPIRVSYTRNNIQIWDDDWVVSAINHAWEDDGADVLSCSWRYQNVVAINTEINNALTSGRNTLGCVIVFAAGNDNNSVSYPANSNPDIIAVGAMSPCGQRKRSSSNSWEVNPGVSTDPQGVSCDNEKWWGSNYGNELDLVVPGVFVPTTDIQGSAGYNTATGTGGNYHQTFNGTSSATPHVAGVTALILSVNPGLTQDQVRDIIESTCTKVGSYSYSTVAGRTNGTWNNEVGYGCLNAYAAVIRAMGGLITGFSQICSSSATYSITPPVAFDSIVWMCGPNLSISSGQNTASCNLSVTGNGSSWVRVRLVSACGSFTLPIKDVWLGIPSTPTDINGFGANGIEFGQNSIYEFNVYPPTIEGVTNYQWQVGGGTILSGEGTNLITVRTASNPNGITKYFDVRVRVENSCGWSSYLWRSGFIGTGIGPMIVISPNPATDEATIELQTEPNKVVSSLKSASLTYASECPEWELEVYSPGQLLKAKTTKLKDKTYKLNTQGWQDGVYIVRAKIGDEIITEKLVVKH